jgi:hypothetical protein
VFIHNPIDSHRAKAKRPEIHGHIIDQDAKLTDPCSLTRLNDARWRSSSKRFAASSDIV